LCLSFSVVSSILGGQKLGMKGKGYTVFSGTKVEPLDFEVISIYYNRFPGLHIVWAKGLSDNFKQLVLLEG